MSKMITDTNKSVTSYAPQSIADSDFIFSIPIYQRLFEWNKTAIYTLLDGILISIIKNDNEYYIGMLTSTKMKNNELKLVDGQQRFTIMTLMGIDFMHRNKDNNYWKRFLLLNDKPRLNFESRDSDVLFLEMITNDKDFYEQVLKYTNLDSKEIPEEFSFINKKMAAGLHYIDSYLNSIHEQLKRLDYGNKNPSDISNKMSTFIFEHLKFFITQLPDYEAKDLNLYFERMNSAGKNLESHEILKVKMLDKINNKNPSDYNYYAKAWDIVADMDTRVFIRRSGKRREDATSFRKRCLAALNIIRGDEAIRSLFTTNDDSRVINAAFIKEDNNKDITEIGNNTGSKTINEIIKGELEIKDPSDGDHRDVPFISMLNFPRFLLQVLYYYSFYLTNDEYYKKKGLKTVKNEDEFKVNEFFSESNLLSTFDHFLSEDHYSDFIDKMFALRVLYDFYVIREKSNDGSYTLLMSRGLSGDTSNDDDIDDDNRIEFSKLRKFQSMLYVNSVNVTYYRWLPRLLHFVYLSKNSSVNGDPVAPNDLLKYLKEIDNCIHVGDLKNKDDKENLDALSYRFIDRYWFWRLDYYLWEGVVDGKITNLDKKYVKSFRFRRNRSIEHLHPQNENKNEKWNDKFKGKPSANPVL